MPVKSLKLHLVLGLLQALTLLNADTGNNPCTPSATDVKPSDCAIWTTDCNWYDPSTPNACGTIVCPDNINIGETSCCNVANKPYDPSLYCCLTTGLVSRTVTACTPEEPSESGGFPYVSNGTVEVGFSEGPFIWMGVATTYEHSIPGGSLTGMSVSFGGWSGMGYADQSTECGGLINGILITPGEMGYDFNGAAALILTKVVPGAETTINIVSLMTVTPSSAGGTVVLNADGTPNKYKYSQAFKGTATLSGGSWSGGNDVVTKKQSSLVYGGGSTTTSAHYGDYPVNVDSVSGFSYPKITHKVCEVDCCNATDQ